jgi:hypothetical protein
MEYYSDIEMQTIRTNVAPQNIPVFKILIDTKCAKTRTSSTNKKIRYTSIILRKDEIYYGNIIMNKKQIYIDITECYNLGRNSLSEGSSHSFCSPNGTGILLKHTSKQCGYFDRDISIYIPVIFDTTGKYMVNVCEYNKPIHF